MTHTPTPWNMKIWDYSLATPPRKELNIENNASLIATLQCDFVGDNPFIIPMAEAEANAAFIVRCCNSHDQLVNLLELCEPFLRNAKGAHIIHADLIIALAAARGEVAL